jgi:hypothetical protein
MSGGTINCSSASISIGGVTVPSTRSLSSGLPIPTVTDLARLAQVRKARLVKVRISWVTSPMDATEGRQDASKVE